MSVPLWVIINELEFGTVRYVYKHSVLESNQKLFELSSVSIFQYKESVQLSPEYIDRMLEHINEMVCEAHNNNYIVLLVENIYTMSQYLNPTAF